MTQFIISLFLVIAPIAIVACVIGTIGGHVFKSFDKEIDSKLEGKRHS